MFPRRAIAPALLPADPIGRETVVTSPAIHPTLLRVSRGASCSNAKKKRKISIN